MRRNVASAIVALLLLATPLLPGAQAAGGMVEDDTGDVRIYSWTCLLITCLPGVPGVSTFPAPDYVDIVAAGITGETESAVTLELDVAGYSDPPAELLAAHPAQFLSYDIRFTVNEDDGEHGVSLYRESTGPGASTWWAYKYRFWCGDDRCFYDSEEMEESEFSFSKEESKATFTLSKDWFAVGRSQRSIREGDAITQVYAYARHTLYVPLGPGVSASDYAYGDVDFTFAFNAPNSIVSLAFVDLSAEEEDEGDGDGGIVEGGEEEGSDDDGRPPIVRGAVSFVPGQTKAVPLMVANDDNQKRLVQLNATFTGEGGAPASGWTVQVPPTVIVPAHGYVVVNALVTAPASAKHLEGGELQVEASVRGVDGIRGVAGRDAYVAQGLTPEANTVYFHSLPGQGDPFLEPVFGDAIQFKPLAASPFREDPLYADPTIDATMGWTYGSQNAVEPSELGLDEKGKIQLTLHLFSERGERPVGVWAGLYAERPTGRYVYLGDAQAEVNVPEAGTDLVLDIPVSKRGATLPEGSRISFEFGFYDPLNAGGFTPTLPGIKLDVTQSHATFPVQEVRTTAFRSTNGEYLPTLSLSKGQGRDEFANPGKTVPFNLTLVNGGTYEDTLDITVAASRPGFATRVVPGNAFRLAPGTAIAFGVEATAPVGAKEGDVVDFTVRASSRNDPEAFSETTVRVTVTTNIELENRTFQASSESINVTVAPDAKEAPAPALGATMLLVAGAVWLARRRREG